MKYYSASCIAKYTGYNKYADPRKEIEQLINPSINLNEIQNKIKELAINNPGSNIRNIQEVDNLNNINIAELSAVINEDPQLVQQSVNCLYGSCNENNVIQLVKEKYGHDIVENNDKCYSSVIDDCFKICGRIDGFIYIDGEKYLVEIKCRKNRIFNVMPIYEKVQILLYTKLCECNKVIYIQNHGKDISLEVFNNFEDNRLYNEVLKRMKAVNACVQGECIDELCYWI